MTFTTKNHNVWWRIFTTKLSWSYVVHVQILCAGTTIAWKLWHTKGNLLAFSISPFLLCNNVWSFAAILWIVGVKLGSVTLSILSFEIRFWTLFRAKRSLITSKLSATFLTWWVFVHLSLLYHSPAPVYIPLFLFLTWRVR